MSTHNVMIASDHAGFELKEYLKSHLKNIQWVDLGPSDASRVDYPDYADRVAQKISSGEAEFGVLICGSGQGMAMRANRYSKVRAALVWNQDSTRLSREHNNANVIALGARLVEPQLAASLIELFLKTQFEGGRHQDRIVKLSAPLTSESAASVARPTKD
jgi:ribose 5-phosphate isomerase B